MFSILTRTCNPMQNIADKVVVEVNQMHLLDHTIKPGFLSAKIESR